MKTFREFATTEAQARRITLAELFAEIAERESNGQRYELLKPTPAENEVGKRARMTMKDVFETADGRREGEA